VLSGGSDPAQNTINDITAAPYRCAWDGTWDMPIVKSNETLPEWGELRRYGFHRGGEADRLEIPVIGPRARILVTEGVCFVDCGSVRMMLRENQFADLNPASAKFLVSGFWSGFTVLVLEGNWGDALGGCGIFEFDATSPPKYQGDPVAYSKSTHFDSHYHDCDEYWILISGDADVVIDDKTLPVIAGDCVVIGNGHHHDIPHVRSRVRAAYFETTLEGKQRVGHLWNHKHGQARPHPARA
jgi:mannose-6-phosphate isomerase-like protein (cupin superfamily)